MPELDRRTELERPLTSCVDDDLPGDSGPSEFGEGLPKSYRSRHDRHYVEQLTAAADAQPVRLVPLSRIDSADLPAEHAAADLVDSIVELGIVQPLLVRPHDGRFRLIAGRRRLAAARLAGLTEVPCLVHTVSETRASQLATAENLRGSPGASPSSLLAPPADVQASLDAHTAAVIEELQDVVVSLQSCLPLLARGTSSRERVAVKLLTAETERAAWIVRARRYLGGTLPLAHGLVNGAALLDQVRRQAGVGMALRGGSLQFEGAPDGVVWHGDRGLLTTVAVGVVQALFALGELVQDSRVTMRLSRESAQIALVITQPAAVLSEAARACFFDAGWTDRPGGAAAELAIRLARHAANLHRARLDVSSAAGAGTAVVMTFKA